jgi:hypothetical protein
MTIEKNTLKLNQSQTTIKYSRKKNNNKMKYKRKVKSNKVVDHISSA